MDSIEEIKEITLVERKSNPELKKHVAVIHSSNKLSLLQRKIANALLFNAYKNLHQREDHTINIAKLCELIGYDSNDYKSIKKALINLISTVLEWNLIDGDRLDKEGVWNASSIIAGASIEGSICTYSYSSQMRNLLYRPTMYGRLDMTVQSQFKSTYGLALYENCNRFQDIGHTPWFDISKFRKLMGVDERKYKIFRDFKTRVLDKAVAEVNTYSLLKISPQLRKANRRVTSIQFLITKPKLNILDNHDLNEDNQSSLAEILKIQFGFSNKQIHQVIASYEEKYIHEKMTVIKTSTNFKNGKIKNLTRYLLSALKDDYQPNKVTFDKDNQDGVKENKSKYYDAERITAFQRFQERELYEQFQQQLSAKEQRDIIKTFEKSLTGVYSSIYLREGLNNLLLREELCNYLKKLDHIVTKNLTSFEDWIKITQIE